MVHAKFIGGPWDGMEMAIERAFEYYDIAELGVTLQGKAAWTDSTSFSKPVETKRVRYHLYDTWPVKYLVEGLK